MPDLEVLTGCCHLLEGICLAEELPARGETANLSLYQRAALAGFEDEWIRHGAMVLLVKAGQALRQAGKPGAADALEPLERLVSERLTPAHALLRVCRESGWRWRPGGFAEGV